MSHDKAIKHGKEKRQPYRRAKAVDASCRNHGSCGYCHDNRTYAARKAAQAADWQLEEYRRGK